MDISFTQFAADAAADPILFFIVAITLGVILLNGWVDAPGTIFTSVSSGSLHTKTAIFLAAVFNFLGVAVMALLCSKVAHTISNLVVFEGSRDNGFTALSAALAAIVLWTSVANHYRLPTSETHAMVAGLTGAAAVLGKGFSAVNGQEWIKVILGIILSLVMAFALTWLVIKLIELLLGGIERKSAASIFKKSQAAAFAGTCFMHGAQDGQKFMGIFAIAVFVEVGSSGKEIFAIPVWLILICSVFMMAGTVIGGLRIQRSTGLLKVNLEKYRGFSADFATCCTLLTASLLGFPISTNHTKIASILGAEGAKGVFSIDLKAMRIMIYSIVWTYLGCGAISVALTVLFLKIV